MSYCRFSNADAYVFLSINGFFECCSCRLEAEGRSSTFVDTAAVVHHLIEHVQAGHDIPEDVFVRLAGEQEENDAWLASEEAEKERAVIYAATPRTLDSEENR